MKIIQKMKHSLDVCKAVAFVTNKEWSAYRTHSLVSVFVGPVYFIVQYFIWTAVYGGKTSLAGMELEQTIRYFGASALIGYLTMDFADWNLQMLVRTGKFLTFALRPINHRFFALSQKIGHRILGFFLEFIPCLIIFRFLFGVKFRPEYLGWTIISTALAFMMNFYVNYCIGMTAFWLVKADGIKNVWQLVSSVLSGAVIPLAFFPQSLQKVLIFLPFQYITYVPAMVATGSYSIGGITLDIPVIVGIQALAVLAVFGISEIMYRASMKRFTGVGA